MSELIERQAAIEAIESIDWYHQNKNKDMVNGANSAEHQAWYKAEDVYRALEQLPSAQPETCSYWDRESNFCALHRPSAQQKWKIYDILDYAQRPTGRKVAKCPFCDYLTDDFRTTQQYWRELTNYCPNCGADMRGTDETNG